MRLVLVAISLAVLNSGCFFDTCGPMSGRVDTMTYLDADFEGNVTVWRQVLLDRGLTIDEDDADRADLLHGQDKTHDVWLQPAYGNESTELRIGIHGAGREFADSPAGNDKARRFADEQAALHQPEAQAIDDALRAAVGLPSKPTPPLYGYISIC